MIKNTNNKPVDRMDTISFIKEAKKIHSNKYDYSKVFFVKPREKVTIICNTHGEFQQEPYIHLNGSGCPTCAITKPRITNDDYIRRIKAIHGNTYDYSKVAYTGSNSKVTLTCPLHGDFTMRADGLLAGRGCKKCGFLKNRNGKNKFIKMFRDKFGDKFDYSKNSNIVSKDKMIVTCPIHGDSYQKPHNHLCSVTGCKKCGIDATKLNTDDFIAKAKTVHGDKYKYDKVIYVNTNKEVMIYCNKHNDYFLQKPINHLSGYGCAVCASNIKRSTEDFIRDAKAIHGNTYDYSKVKYNGNKEPVTLICKIHGEFKVKPNAHLVNKSGCPVCSSSNGEKLLREIFCNLNLNFKTEYTPPRIKRKYRYDFYLEDFNIFIEYNGIQHYEPIDFFGGLDNFKLRVAADMAKKRIVWRIKGNLITIKYVHDTIDKVKKVLIKKLKQINKIWVNDNGTIRAFKNFHEACKFYNLPGTTTNKTVLQELALLNIKSIF